MSNRWSAAPEGRSDPCIKNTANGVSDNDNNFYIDALRAYQLRFRFVDQSFTGTWKTLRESGWTFDAASRSYSSPTGRVFESALSVTQFLDQHAIPDFRGNLDTLDLPLAKLPSTSKSTPWTVEERELAWKIREQFASELFKRRPLSVSSANSVKEESFEDEDEASTGMHGEGKDNHQNVNSAERNVKYKSVTVTDNGAQLYMDQKNKNKSQKRLPKCGTGDEKNDPTLFKSIFESLKTPSVEACRHMLHEKRLQVKSSVSSFHREQFFNWRYLLSTNHSLLLYGAGSKYKLLNAFVDDEIRKEGYALVINGFDNEVSIEGILDLLQSVFLEEDGTHPYHPRKKLANGYPDGNSVNIPPCQSAQPIVERATRLGRALAVAYSECRIPIFLVIHTLEGLANQIAQEALSNLLIHSKAPNGVAVVRLVASVDHVDACLLLWTTTTSTNFSWIHQVVHTHEPCVDELNLLPLKKMVEASQRKTIKSNGASKRAFEVLRSLAPQHTEVVQILARLQLASMERNRNMKTKPKKPEDATRITYSVFRKACRDAYAVNRDSQLRILLSELQDHNLVTYSNDWVSIPYDEAKLTEFIAYRPDR